jgi:hypothetical protein
MRISKKLLLAAVLLCPIAAQAPTPAKADLIFFGQVDIGAAGFGDAHRLLDMHLNGEEAGFMTPTDVCNGQAICSGTLNLKEGTPTLTTLGWTSGANVGLGFNVSQEGNTGLTLQTLGFNLYNGSAIVGTFGIASPFAITPAMAKLDTGNGNGLLDFVLSTQEQTAFNLLVGKYGMNLEVGAFGDWGCGPTAPAGCMPSNDGQDSLLGFNQFATVPGPAVGAGLPGAAFAALGLLWFSRQRRQRLAF